MPSRFRRIFFFFDKIRLYLLVVSFCIGFGLFRQLRLVDANEWFRDDTAVEADITKFILCCFFLSDLPTTANIDRTVHIDLDLSTN